MAWRDRTNLYISYRQSYSHYPAKKSHFSNSNSNGFSEASGSGFDESLGLMSAGAYEDDGDAVIEMDVLPPRWTDISDEITVFLADIARKSQKLEKLHQKHVLPGFDDDEVKRNEEGEIERLTQDITRGFHDCQRAIQRVDAIVKDSKQHGGISTGEETMARNIQISLAGRVQEASANFRKKQSAYLKKLRGLGGMTPSMDRSSTPRFDSYTDPSLMESDADKSYSQTTLQQTTQKQLTSNDAAIIQREREITEIAQGIIELADIFKELQTMIIDQGTMLDRIDYNVEVLLTNVKGAEKELTVATGYQKRGTRRMIILLLVLLVVGMFIILLIKPKRRDSQAENDPEAAITPEGEASILIPSSIPAALYRVEKGLGESLKKIYSNTKPPEPGAYRARLLLQ